MTESTTELGLEFTLTHDTEKQLKAGKRRYSDADGHLIYLSAEQVQRFGTPDAITLKVDPVHSSNNNK